MTSELRDLLTRQVNHELAASYSYLAASAWLESTPYGGFAAWMESQSEEERLHAMKFYRFLLDRGEEIKLHAIPEPRAEYSSVLEVFEASLAQEKEVTRQIHQLYEAAETASDHESKNLLNWFLDEQVEEEKSVQDMIDRLQLVGDNPIGLLQLDAEAADRNAPAPSGSGE